MPISKITHLLKSPAVKQGSVVLIDQGMMSLVSLIAGVLIARASTAEEYALYMLGWSLLNSIKGIHEALVNLPFTIYAPRLTDREFRLYKGSTFVHTVLFCLIFGAALLITEFLNTKHLVNMNFELLQMAPLLLFLLSTYLFRDFLRNALLAQLKIWESVRINGFASLLLIITITAFYYLQHLTPTNTYLLFSVTFGITSAAIFWQQRFQYKIDRNLLWKHFLKNWQTGKWALVGNFAFIGSRMSYPWLILYYLDYKSVAAYYACSAIATAPAPILRGTNAYILPRMSHSYREQLVGNLTRLLRKSILLLCIPYFFWLIIGIIFNEELIRLFYTEKYNEYGALFILLLITATIDFVFAPLTNALQVLEKTKAITVSVIIGAFITLLLGPFFIKEFGLYGAGVSVIVSISGTIAWRIFVFVKNIPLQKP